MASPEAPNRPSPEASERPAAPAWPAAAAAALLAAALVVDQLAFASRHQRGLINSDSLYTHAWLRDLLRFGEGFIWLTPPNPSLFPDAFAFLVGLLLTDDVGLQFLSYSIAFLLLLMAALGSVIRQLTRAWTTALLLAGIAIGGIAVFPELMVAYRAHVPLANVHGGAFLAGVAFLSLAMHLLLAPRVGRAAHSALVALAALTTASDLVFPVQFVLPVIAGALILAAWGVIERARVVRFAFDNAVAAALAFLLRQAISATPHVDIARVPWDPSYQKAVNALHMLLSEWIPWIGGQLGGPGLAMLLAWLALTAYVLRRRRHAAAGSASPGRDGLLERQILFLVVTANVVMIGSLAAPVLTGRWHGEVTHRYVWPAPLLGLLLLIPLLLVMLSGRAGRVRHAVGVAGILLAMVLTGRAAPGIEAARLTFAPDAITTRLLELKREGQISSGLGHHWSAWLLTAMSGHAVDVNAVTVELGPELWATNATRFIGKSGGDPPRYDFILTSRLDRDLIVRTYGEPARIEKHGEHELFLYGRPIGEDLALRACRHLFERRKDCPLLGPDRELLAAMMVGDAGARRGAGIASVAGRHGAVAYGPYLRLPAGRYEVTWRLSGQTAQAPLRFMIFSRWGRNVVHVGSDPQAVQHGVVRAVFEVDRRHEDDLWEFPLLADQPADIALASVRVRRID